MGRIEAFHGICRVPFPRACTGKNRPRGIQDLKVELIRQATEAGNRRDVDINFPFDATSTPAQVMERMEGLYQTTWPKRRNCSTPHSSTTPPSSSCAPDTVDIYTPRSCIQREMFRDCYRRQKRDARRVEAQVRTALASGPDHAAIVISYSGLAPNLREILPILSSRRVPVIVIGTRTAPAFTRLCRLSHGERPREHDASHHAVRQPHRRAIRARFAL